MVARLLVRGSVHGVPNTGVSPISGSFFLFHGVLILMLTTDIFTFSLDSFSLVSFYSVWTLLLFFSLLVSSMTPAYASVSLLSPRPTMLRLYQHPFLY